MKKENLTNKCCWSVALMAALLFLNGCGMSLFIPPEQEAVVDEHVFFPFFGESGVHALSTKIERRLVLMEQKREQGKDNYHHDSNDNEDKFTLTVCAESPPEAAQALKSISKFSGNFKNIETTEAALAATRSLATAVSVAFKRTQGLQFYRDGAYQLCQAYLNGLITKDGYHCAHCFLDRLETLQETAKELIQMELHMEDFYKKNFLKAEKTKNIESMQKSIKATEEKLKQLEEEVSLQHYRWYHH